MAVRSSHLAALVALAGAVAMLLTGLAASPLAASAEASACERWGDSDPRRLAPGRARAAVACLVNRERKRRGMPRLDRDRRLQRAAQRHNRRMHGTGCFAHACPGEPGLDGRLRNVGYLRGGLRRWAYGENVAWGVRGRGTPRAIVGAWMSSSGHRSNILGRGFKELGVGFSPGTPQGKSDPGGIYTIDFGLAVR